MAEIPPACLRDGRLGAARVLLVAMYSLTPRGADQPLVFARHSTLASLIGSDGRTVRRQLATLREHGYIRQVDAGWELAVRSDGSRCEWAGTASEADDLDRKADDPVRPGGQYCPPARSTSSAPTLEEPELDQGSEGGGKSPSAPLQFELVAPEPERDLVAELWLYQDELRAWAFRQRGRTGRRAPRPLDLDSDARKAVRAVLREYDEQAIREALRNCARDAAGSDRSLSFFDGVSNWRRKNFRRYASVDSDLLSARERTTVRSASTGPLLPECGAKDEQCRRDDEKLRARASTLLDEVVA